MSWFRYRMTKKEVIALREHVARAEHDEFVAERQRREEYTKADAERKAARFLKHAHELKREKAYRKLQEEKQWMTTWLPQVVSAFIIADTNNITDEPRQQQIVDASIALTATMIAEWLESRDIVDKSFEAKWAEREDCEELGSA